jgi:hypothetical protein
MVRQSRASPHIAHRGSKQKKWQQTATNQRKTPQTAESVALNPETPTPSRTAAITPLCAPIRRAATWRRPKKNASATRAGPNRCRPRTMRRSSSVSGKVKGFRLRGCTGGAQSWGGFRAVPAHSIPGQETIRAIAIRPGGRESESLTGTAFDRVGMVNSNLRIDYR